jgi:tetratricopeptide (TPR) repeat protein
MRSRWTLAVAAAVAISAVAALPAIAAPAAVSGPAAMPDRPDLQAANLFQSGRYADALAIYQRLYAETHHPTYLRNIGRCHQMLRQPQPAIENFRAYLRDARNLEPAEHTEIEGYIAEMQRLEVGAAPPGAPGWSPASAGPTATVSAPGAAVASSGSGGITHEWWFWTGLGVLVAAGVITAVAASGGKERLPCPSGAVCPP